MIKLTECETNFLQHMLNMFITRDVLIVKTECKDNNYCTLRIRYNDALTTDVMVTPAFKKDSLYKEMQTNKYYKPEELGIINRHDTSGILMSLDSDVISNVCWHSTDILVNKGLPKKYDYLLNQPIHCGDCIKLKIFIYCKKDGTPLVKHMRDDELEWKECKLNNKVIGEALCDLIYPLNISIRSERDFYTNVLAEHTGLTLDDIKQYAENDIIYLYKLTNITIYHEPIDIHDMEEYENGKLHKFVNAPEYWSYVVW